MSTNPMQDLRAKVPTGGGLGAGAKGRGAVGRVARAGGRGGTAGAKGAGWQPAPRGWPPPCSWITGRQGRRPGRAVQPHSFLPRANLEVRENMACLQIEGFQLLPTEEEFVQCMEVEIFKDELSVMVHMLVWYQLLTKESLVRTITARRCS